MNLLAQILAEQPTPDAIFKSMNEQMSAEVNPVQILAVVAAVVGLVVLLSVFKKRDRRPPRPTEVNNPSKLLRQMAREVGLKRREVRELKKLADVAGVEHALTLLLCPSLMQAAIAKRRASRP